MTRQVISSGGHEGGGAASGCLAVEDEGVASGGILWRPQGILRWMLGEKLGNF